MCEIWLYPVNFDKFWRIATAETSGGCEYQTIVQNKVFEATYSLNGLSGNVVIIIQPKTVGVNGKIRVPRTLRKIDFQVVWKIAETLPPQEVFRPTNYQDDTFNASYILAMIKTILDGEEIEQL